WYWTVVHPGLYASLPVTAQWARVATNARNVATDLGHVITVGILGSLVAWRRGDTRAPWAIAFLVLSIPSAFHSRFLYRHYFALVLPAAAAVGGAGFAWLGDAWLHNRSPSVRAAATAAAALFAFGVPVLARPSYWLRPDPVAIVREALGEQGFEAAPMLAQFL